MKVTAKSGNQVTLLNISAPTQLISTDAGNYAKLGSDNLVYVPAAVPTGTVLDFAGTATPMGFLLCDGTVYNIATYPALGALLGSTYGGNGTTTFGVPDCRSRATIGTGQGTGLTNRTLGSVGGEETHALVTGELASHSHTMGNHYHNCAGVDHLHDLQNHQHYCGGVDHLHAMNDPGHSHVVTLYWTPVTATGANKAESPGGATAYTRGTDARGVGVYVSGADRSLAFWSNAPNINNTGAADRSLAFNSGGPSTNTSDATGSGTGHNTMMPFIAFNKIIKT
jgi:microcystin-dependent protein